MPTSAPGSRRRARAAAAPARSRHARGGPALTAGRGFTVIELMIVLAIVAVAAALMSAALPDRQQLRLEEEGERLAALLEAARVESRVSGVAVRWVPLGADTPARGDAAPGEADFAFVGLSALQSLPTRWLDPATRAEVAGRAALVLGPEPMLPPQRVQLALGPHRLTVASDGLGPFGAAAPAADDAAAPR